MKYRTSQRKMTQGEMEEKQKKNRKRKYENPNLSPRANSSSFIQIDSVISVK